MLLKPSQQTMGEIHTFPLWEQENPPAGIFFFLFSVKSFRQENEFSTPQNWTFVLIFSPYPISHIYCIIHPR